MNVTSIVNGSTTIAPTGGGAGTVTPGGLFAQPTNIGTITHNHFCYVPELNANLLYNINSNWRAMVGYTFIYWNQVVLAGNQIDRNVDPSQFAGGPLVGPATPQARFSRTDFWVQGSSWVLTIAGKNLRRGKKWRVVRTIRASSARKSDAPARDMQPRRFAFLVRNYDRGGSRAVVRYRLFTTTTHLLTALFIA